MATVDSNGGDGKMEQAAIEEKLSHVSVGDFRPSCSAQSGSNVVNLSFIGSNNGGGGSSISISINSAGAGAADSSGGAPDRDGAGGCGGLQPRHDRVAECRQQLRATLKRMFNYLLAGMTTEAGKIPLNDVYTELYVTEGGCGGINKEHEVRRVAAASRARVTQEKSIHCNQLFAPEPGRDGPTRTVMTMGVAGIGKTVSANKFTLDWAEEKANAHLEFVFPLSFRELNLMRGRTLSLEELIGVFFPETRDTGIFANGSKKMLFILDGLDESRLSWNFRSSEIVPDVAQRTSVDLILTNLIRGRLLPLASVWITTRPAASGQIPVEYIDLVTEVRGFNDAQKDEFFRRRIGDRDLANRVIAHVRSCRSLHIMCHIPVFCRMAAGVLEHRLAAADGEDTPRTLTQMYIHFLSLYAEDMKKKLCRRDSNAECMRSNLVSLGKLAFKELEKGHLIFYENDLTLHGISGRKASMFSGVYTQIFSEELTLCREKMFCFVHLSVQEFFAALYVFLAFHNDNINALAKKPSVSWRFLSRDSSELVLYKAAVEKALRCENGHFDIFLRFLLGLSLESNQALLKHLMTHNRASKRTRSDVIKHIKEMIRSSPSPDRCLNLFHCLNELNDHSLVDEIQSYLGSDGRASAQLSPAQWATLVFVLLTSEEELRVFKLSDYSRTEEGLVRLQPVVRTAQVANLSACNLTAASGEILANVVSSSRLRELDLSGNELTDAGLLGLAGGLKNSQLDTLSLRSCSLTERSSDALAGVLSSGPGQLKVLDLSDNELRDVGVKRLSAGLGSPRCKLEKLMLSLCRVTEEGCTFLASALNSSHLRELDLSYNHPGDSGVKLLSTLQLDPRCRLENLSVAGCGESRIQPGPKIYARKLALDPNTAHRDLSLTDRGRRATRWGEQSYPDRPERFDFWAQVLCTEGLTGRCYWETEWRGRAFIGVAYGRMCRKGEGRNCWLGRNESSWGLNCNKDGYRAYDRGSNAALTARPGSDRVGVYLDWSAGKLSFFMVSDGALTPLHTFRATFTEPVIPGFWLGWVDSMVGLC